MPTIHLLLLLMNINEKATVVERIMNYMDANQPAQAEALAKVCDYLEECYCWDITFDE